MKYHNKKVHADGEVFDSEREYARWQELKLLERAGAITDLRRQVRFEVIPKHGKERAAFYIADFTYMENGKEVVEDCKGFRTDVYKLKRKLMLDRYGIEIRET